MKRQIWQPRGQRAWSGSQNPQKQQGGQCLSCTDQEGKDVAPGKNPVSGPLLRWKLLDPHFHHTCTPRERSRVQCSVFKTFFQNIPRYERKLHKNNLVMPKELVTLGGITGRRESRQLKARAMGDSPQSKSTFLYPLIMN